MQLNFRNYHTLIIGKVVFLFMPKCNTLYKKGVVLKGTFYTISLQSYVFIKDESGNNDIFKQLGYPAIRFP